MRPVSLPVAGLLALSLLAAGCATTPTTEPAPGPAGKMPAGSSGQMSPVPAFKGGGNGWSINIASAGSMNHDVQLVVGDIASPGNLRYSGQPAGAPDSLIVLGGELRQAQGSKPMTVEIKRQSCPGSDGRERLYSVQVSVEGMEQLRGCGDLAQY